MNRSDGYINKTKQHTGAYARYRHLLLSSGRDENDITATIIMHKQAILFGLKWSQRL